MAEYLSPDVDRLNPLIRDTLLNKPIGDREPNIADMGLDVAGGLVNDYIFPYRDIRGIQAANQYKPVSYGSLPPSAAIRGTGPRGNTVGSDADPNTPGLQGPGAPGASTTESQPGGIKAPGYSTNSTTGVIDRIFDLYGQQLEQANQQNQRITSPEYLDDQLRRRKEELAYATDILSKAQMGQMREKTRRDVIDGWRKIQQEKIRANTVMATAMMNTAYLAATPNANVLSALNVASDSAMRAFQPGQAVN